MGFEQDVESMTAAVKELVAELKGFQSTVGGMSKSPTKGYGRGQGQMDLGNSGRNALANSMGNFSTTELMNSARSWDVASKVLGGMTKIGTGIAAGAMQAMPSVTATTDMAKNYWSASLRYGGNAQSLGNYMTGAMRGAMTDPLGASRVAGNLSAMGFAQVGGMTSGFNNAVTATANLSKYMGIDNDTASMAVGGLSSRGTSQNLMRNFGMFTTNPMTGKTNSAQQTISMVGDRLLSTAGGAKLSAEDVLGSLKSGYLGSSLQASGLDENQQAIVQQYMISKVSGKKFNLDEKGGLSQVAGAAGANPYSAEMSISSSQASTMNTATQAYIKGNNDAAIAVGKLQGAIENFIKAHPELAEANAAINTAMKDNAVQGGVTAAKGLFDGLGDIGSAILGAKGLGSIFGKGGWFGGKGGGLGTGATGAGGAGAAEIGGTGATGAASVAGGFAGLNVGLSGLAAVSAMKAQSYQGPNAAANINGDIQRAQAEYGKYYSPTEFLLATGKKGSPGWSGTTSALGNPGWNSGSPGNNMGGVNSRSAEGRTTDTSTGLKLIRPVRGRISAKYGSTGGPHTVPHLAIDFAVAIGSAVLAAADGKVVEAGGPSKNTYGTSDRSYGMHVRLQHAGGYYTVYAHLSQIAVSVGQEVKQGQAIGASGNTGYSTGPHLHWELRKGAQKIDPTPFMTGGSSGDYSQTVGSNDGKSTTGGLWVPDGGTAGGTPIGDATTGSAGGAPAAYSGASVGGSAAATVSAGGSRSVLGIGMSTVGAVTSVGDGMGGGSDAPAAPGRAGGGTNVTINVNVPNASAAEAEKFAVMVKDFLDKDRLATSMGRA